MAYTANEHITHYPDDQVGPRRTDIVKAGLEKNPDEDDLLVMDRESFHFLQKRD